jgi:hypothetical protein
MITRTERHPARYDYRSRFPDLKDAGGSEGVEIFIAQENGEAALIADESTLLDILDESDREVGISIHFFTNEAARERYLETLRGNADFKTRARIRQAEFKRSLSAAAQALVDDHCRRHPFLLAGGSEEENLYPGLRGPGGAKSYFADRRIQWWRSARSGDPPGNRGPTRNMTSSQVACINLFLPLLQERATLAAMLRSLDPEIVDVAPVPYTAPNGRSESSLVELEWTGRKGTLEGRGSRGSRATSADACVIGVTSAGARRLFLFECKYTESYTTRAGWRGDGPRGDERRRCYGTKYGSQDSCLSGAAPLDEVLYEPFYQIVRLGLLADAARADTEMGLSDSRVIVVCPEGNTAYRDRITSPGLRHRFPDVTTVGDVASRLWRDEAGVAIVDPGKLVDVVREDAGAPMHDWSYYLKERYGW